MSEHPSGSPVPETLLSVRTEPAPSGEPAVVVSVAGEVDLATVSRLRQELTLAVDDRNVRLVVLNMAEVSFLGSAGLAVLVEAHQDLQARGGSLRIVVGDRRNVVRAFTATGLTDVFTLARSVEAALATPGG